jgi:hypothetical protein
MKRSAPIARMPFKAKVRPLEPRPIKTISDDYTIRPRAPTLRRDDGKARMVVAVPKQNYLRDKDYLRWVASLPCAHCGVEGRSQAAHSDDNGAGGKGIGLKSSDKTVYPACAPTLGNPGCHWLIGSSGVFKKDERRELESAYSQKTWGSWLKSRRIGTPLS